jgi:hypothetical protein
MRVHKVENVNKSLAFLHTKARRCAMHETYPSCGPIEQKYSGFNLFSHHPRCLRISEFVMTYCGILLHVTYHSFSPSHMETCVNILNGCTRHARGITQRYRRTTHGRINEGIYVGIPFIEGSTAVFNRNFRKHLMTISVETRSPPVMWKIALK